MAKALTHLLTMMSIPTLLLDQVILFVVQVDMAEKEFSGANNKLTN